MYKPNFKQHYTFRQTG